jgi:phosphate ABC transporter permease protein PstC
MLNVELKEKIIEKIFLTCAVSSIAIIFLIFIAVTYMGSPVISSWIQNGFGLEWGVDYGILRYVLSTLYVGAGATVAASLIGIPCAIFLSEFSDKKIRNLVKPSLEILTGFPSVVMGIIGLILIVGMLSQAFGMVEPAYGILAAWILLGIMSLPHVASISEDSMRAVPQDLREASLALGATQWQTTRKVVVPYAKSGILAAIILGMGNAIGETMAVMFIIGKSTQPPLDLFALLKPTDVIPSLIASTNIRGSEGDVNLSGVFAAGFVLFVIIFGFNMLIRRAMKGSLVKTGGKN